MSNQRPLLLPLAVACLLAAWLAAARVDLERRADTAMIVVDLADLRAAASRLNRDWADLAGELQRHGLGGIAVREPAFEELAAGGCLLSTPSQLTVTGPTNGQILAAAKAVARLRGQTDPAAAGGFNALDLTFEAVRTAGAGLDLAALRQVREAGLEPIARPLNSPGLSPPAVAASLAEIAASDCRLVVFTGKEILGYPGLLPETAAALTAHGLRWGKVEFASQTGEQTLGQLLLADPGAPGYLRAHGIPEKELLTMSRTAMAERYVRAARERNVRLLFYQLPLGAGPDLLSQITGDLSRLSARLAATGIRLGQPEPFPVWSAPLWALAGLAGAGVAALAALLAICLAGQLDEPGRWWRWWLPLAVVLAGLVVVKPGAGVKLAALVAGVAGPTMGIVAAWRQCRLRPPAGPLAAVALLLWAAAWPLAAGLLTVGLLADTRYLLQQEAYSGVKLTLFGPLLLGVWLLAAGLVLPDRDPTAGRRWVAAQLARPVLLGQVVGLLLVAGLAGFMLLRSGNEGIGVLGVERALRAWLEDMLVARPRTKEFLLGHPAIVLAGLAVWRGRGGWAAPLVLLGGIGLASVYNTFCHIHTPLGLSLLRTAHGLWIGAGLGLAAGLTIRFRPRWLRGDDGLR